METASPVLPAMSAAAATAGVPPATAAATEDGPGFFETILDIVNPLQHIPVVSSIYREITGDTVVPAARLVGGALFGGPLGFAAALVNAVVEQDSGKDIGEHALALLDGGDTPADLRYLAEAEAGAGATAPPDTAGKLALADIVWSGPRVGAALARPEDGTAPDADPAWLGVAMADARSLQEAAQYGVPPTRPEAQPWIAAAMLSALDKYEAMARLRSVGPGSGESEGHANERETAGL